MKTTMLLIAILFTMNLNAQWYSTQFGVTDMSELNEVQLNVGLEQSLQSIKTGQIITGVSTVVAIVGTMLYTKGLKDITSSTTYSGMDDGLDKGMNGVLLMTAGYVGMCVGIPVWVVGEQRKNTINMHLAKYGNTSYVPSIGIKLTF